MRKYLMSLFLTMATTMGAYAIALDHGATREHALLIAFAAAAFAAAAAAAAAPAFAVAAFAVAVVAVVAVAAVAAVAVVAVAAVAAADELKVKVRWVLLANLATLAFVFAGLASMNPTYIFGFMLSGGFILRWIGDMPKAELEATREEEKV